MLEINNSFLFQTMLKNAVFLGFSAGMLGVFISYQRRSIEINALSAGSFVGTLLLLLMSSFGLSISPYIFGQVDKDIYSFTGSVLGILIMITILNMLYKTNRLHPHIIQSLMTAVLLGVGITLVTSIKQAGSALDSGIDVYLFGEATSLTDEKFYFLRIITLTVIVLLLLFFRRLRVVIFNIDMAKTTHFHTMYYVHLINIFVVCLVALSVKLMGVFLAVSIFLIPAVTARLWSNRLFIITLLSGFFGGIGGGIGAVIAGNISNVSSGISITIVLSMMFFISLLIAPYKGLLGVWLRGRK